MNAIDNMQTNKLVVSRLYDEVLNQNRGDIVAEVIAPEFVNRTFGQRGPAEVAATVCALHNAFEELSFSVEDMVAENDRVTVRLHMQGKHVKPFFTNQPSGKQVEQEAIVVFRLMDGKIAEQWMQSSGLKEVA